MSGSEAIALVEKEHGSLEAFCYNLTLNYPEFTSGAHSLDKKAKKTNLPPAAIVALMTSKDFQRRLRETATMAMYSLEDTVEHIAAVVDAAKGQGFELAGGVKPMDAINAGRYLEELKGTPLKREQEQGGLSIVVNIGPQLNAYGELVESTKDEYTIDMQSPISKPELAYHAPSGLFSKPPQGVYDKTKDYLDGNYKAGEAPDYKGGFEFYSDEDASEAETGAPASGAKDKGTE